jgi:hypothetical protein
MYWFLAGSILVVLGSIDSTNAEAICLWPPCDVIEYTTNSKEITREESTNSVVPTASPAVTTSAADPLGTDFYNARASTFEETDVVVLYTTMMEHVTNSLATVRTTPSFPIEPTQDVSGPGVTEPGATTVMRSTLGPSLERSTTDSGAGFPDPTSGIKGPTPPLTPSQSSGYLTTTPMSASPEALKEDSITPVVATLFAVGMALFILFCATLAIVLHKRGNPCSRALVACRVRAGNPDTPGDIALTAIDTPGERAEYDCGFHTVYLGTDSDDMV